MATRGGNKKEEKFEREWVNQIKEMKNFEFNRKEKEEEERDLVQEN